MKLQEVKKHYRTLMDIVESKMFDHKNKEYASEEDALSNFKDASFLTGYEPELVAWLYATKHYTSIVDLMKKIFIDNNEKVFNSSDLIKEKFTDMIAYLVLIYCLIYEKR